jgi:putative DNA primase/helicase
MLIGSGANGKSVLLNVLSALVGLKQTCAVQPTQFENRFQRGHLQGRLANIITEIAEGAEIADAQLKSLVSGEMTTAEHKHKDPFDFIPYAKHWFGTNHLPHTRDFSDALFRRAIIVTFNNKFEGDKRDVHLADRLKAELPGILNLALAGLQRLIENNTFTTSASSIEIIKQWRVEADQVAQFVAEECESGTKCRIASAVLYRGYQSWADAAGVRRTLNRNNFTNRLGRLGFKPGRGTGGQRMIEGIQMRVASNAEISRRLR